MWLTSSLVDALRKRPFLSHCWRPNAIRPSYRWKRLERCVCTKSANCKMRNHIWWVKACAFALLCLCSIAIAYPFAFARINVESSSKRLLLQNPQNVCKSISHAFFRHFPKGYWSMRPGKRWNKCLQRPIQISQKTKKFRLNPQCVSCNLRVVCPACVATAKLETDSYNGVPEYLCRYAKETVRLFREEQKKYKNESGGKSTVPAKEDEQW